MSLSREWLGASEISTLWINYVDIRPSEPLFTSTMGWMVENLFSKKCSWDRLLLIVECHCVATQWINHFFGRTMVAQRNKHDYDSLAINQPIKFLQVGNLRGYFVKTYNDRRKDMVNFFSFAIALCLSFGCLSIDAYGYNYILVQKDEERQVYLDKDSVKCSKGLCSYTTKIEFTEAGKSSAVRRGLRPETNYLLINDAVMCSDSPFISHLISMECVSENNFKLIYNPYAANFETIPIVNEHDLNGTIYRLICFR